MLAWLTIAILGDQSGQLAAADKPITTAERLSETVARHEGHCGTAVVVWRSRGWPITQPPRAEAFGAAQCSAQHCGTAWCNCPFEVVTVCVLAVSDYTTRVRETASANRVWPLATDRPAFSGTTKYLRGEIFCPVINYARIRLSPCQQCSQASVRLRARRRKQRRWLKEVKQQR